MLKRKANYASCYKFYHNLTRADLQVHFYPSLELIHFEAFRILAGYTLLFQLVLPKLLAVSKPDIHKVTKIKPKQNLWYSTLVIQWPSKQKLQNLLNLLCKILLCHFLDNLRWIPTESVVPADNTSVSRKTKLNSTPSISRKCSDPSQICHDGLDMVSGYYSLLRF